MSEERIYIANGKEFGEYGSVKIPINLSKLPKEHMYEYKGEKFINIIVNKKKSVDQYGKTHSVEVDTWRPEKKDVDGYPKNSAPKNPAYTPSNPWDNDDEVGF